MIYIFIVHQNISLGANLWNLYYIVIFNLRDFGI